MTELLNGYHAAAYAAHYAGARLVIGEGEISSRMRLFPDFVGKLDYDIEAAMAAALSGNRSLVARTVDMKKAALMRAAVVAVSEDPFSARDSGAIIFLPENNQELFDFIILSYLACENKKIMLPAVVGMDFLSAHTRESVDVSTQKIIENFLPKPEIEKIEKRFQQQLDDSVESKAVLNAAMENAKKTLPAVFGEWKKKFRRQYGPVEKFMIDDASTVIVTYGSISSNARLAVNQLRASGEKVGLLRIRVLRPFPDASLAALAGKKLAVVEPTHAAGSGGMLCSEIRSRGYECSNYICGKSVSVSDFMNIFKRASAAQKPERIWMV